MIPTNLNTTSAPTITQTQIVTTTLKKRKNWRLHPIKNTTGCIISLLSIGVIIFLLLSAIFFGLWIRTWAVFTQERVVGYVTVSKLQSDKTCKNYYSLTFDGQDVEAGFNRVFSWGDKTIHTEKFSIDKVYGDEFFVYSSFFQWKNWLTFLGEAPLYKISSIRPDYYDYKDSNNYNSCRQSIPVNGGEDQFWKSVLEGKSLWSFGAEATSIQSVGQVVKADKEQKFEVIITHEGLTLKEVSL